MSIIKAAAIRAARTLIQGIISGGLVTAALAIFTEGAEPAVVIAAAATVVGAAIASFLQGILAGLPEATEPFDWELADPH